MKCFTALDYEYHYLLQDLIKRCLFLEKNKTKQPKCVSCNTSATVSRKNK